MIHFGTSGWRGVVGQEFTFRNVRLAMDATAAVLRERGISGEIAVSYDTRLLSEKLALEAASVFTHHGLPVVMSERDLPTPCLAFAVRERSSTLGVMFTASHNSADYNGVKLLTSPGSALGRELPGAIEAQVAKGEGEFNDFFVPQRHLFTRSSLTEGYLASLERNIDWDAIAASGLVVAVDPLFGTAREFLDRLLLGHSIKTEVVHGTKDPYFGGYSPECSPQNMAGLRECVRSSRADLGLATDGDADRFGVLDSGCRAITANLAVALLVDYLFRRRGITGGVGRTVATTRMVDRIAAANRRELIVTAVGFQHFSPFLLSGRLGIGTEESAGLGVAVHMPERDGIFAALLMAEMVAVEKRSLAELVRALYARHGVLLSRRVQLPLRDRTKAALELLNGRTYAEFAGSGVVKVDRRDGLLLELAGGGWVLIRKAGTEPKLRIYAEATSSQQLLALVREARRLVARAEEEVSHVRD